jgi:uncharacterized protein
LASIATDVLPELVLVVEERLPDMGPALLIFVRNLIAGKVKTRLAATMGDERALEIYKTLLNQTYQAVGRVKVSKHVFYSESIEKEPGHPYQCHVQQGADLGQRMENAFADIFADGYSKAIIIGSDIPELDHRILQEAFNLLDRSDIVMGPACDGGYYLLGMKNMHRILFQSVPWSTSRVLEITRQRIKESGLQCRYLQRLNDIDEEQDWNLYESRGRL